jgi:hypothetical protein
VTEQPRTVSQYEEVDVLVSVVPLVTVSVIIVVVEQSDAVMVSQLVGSLL